MVNIYDKDGTVSLEADDYELKISTDRQLYLKKKGKTTFESLGHEIPYGLSLEEKKKYIYQYYRLIEEARMKRREEQEAQR